MNREQMIAWLTLEGWVHMAPMEYSSYPDKLYYVRNGRSLTSIGVVSNGRGGWDKPRHAQYVTYDEPDVAWDSMPTEYMHLLVELLHG